MTSVTRDEKLHKQTLLTQTLASTSFPHLFCIIFHPLLSLEILTLPAPPLPRV